jgi:hypothetical protein
MQHNRLLLSSIGNEKRVDDSNNIHMNHHIALRPTCVRLISDQLEWLTFLHVSSLMKGIVTELRPRNKTLESDVKTEQRILTMFSALTNIIS